MLDMVHPVGILWESLPENILSTVSQDQNKATDSQGECNCGVQLSMNRKCRLFFIFSFFFHNSTIIIITSMSHPVVSLATVGGGHRLFFFLSFLSFLHIFASHYLCIIPFISVNHKHFKNIKAKRLKQLRK
ncbi:hypothetical protein BDV23DRAFT_147088 [Aspergillus alliaceus]|uniref:Uncharacterized protein n=1 Tax=Petromyces alliaceus TaxID=209559 RepID=A0A5N7CKK2_PETAA|nr:hypothetical protein BDV23DRAFT_147088 [Aspergillus alliaceus]